MNKPRVQKNVPLKPFNTFGIDVKAKHFLRLQNAEALQSILNDDQWRSTPKLVLGAGSNVLFTKDYPGLVIKNELSGIEVIEENKDHIWLQVGAGENWHQFVIHCVENHYSGVENLSLIPGSMGAAPIQNIGAYGVEMRSVFFELEAIELTTGNTVTFNNDDCKFGYRNSIFKNTHKDLYIVCKVTLRLNKQPSLNTSYGIIQQTLNKMDIKTPDIKSISDAVIHIRQTKLPDPNKIPNAGSFFKNPLLTKDVFTKLQSQHPEIPHYPAENHQIKIPAAWLIEQCGWKGKRYKNAGVHDQQALVLINHNNANGEDLKNLAKEIQQSVLDRFSVSLIPEVNIID